MLGEYVVRGHESEKVNGDARRMGEEGSGAGVWKSHMSPHVTKLNNMMLKGYNKWSCKSWGWLLALSRGRG